MAFCIGIGNTRGMVRTPPKYTPLQKQTLFLPFLLAFQSFDTCFFQKGSWWCASPTDWWTNELSFTPSKAHFLSFFLVCRHCFSAFTLLPQNIVNLQEYGNLNFNLFYNSQKKNQPLRGPFSLVNQSTNFTVSKGESSECWSNLFFNIRLAHLSLYLWPCVFPTTVPVRVIFYF